MLEMRMLLVPKFQSTLPVRGATFHCLMGEVYRNISIHAPREGSDADPHKLMYSDSRFQSTLPVRGATVSIGVT